MREYKFRGRSKRTGKLIYGDLLTSPNGVLKYIVQKRSVNGAFLENLPIEEVEHDSIDEYIDHKDKNGVEIYTRDFVKTDIADGWIAQVLFEDDSYFCSADDGYEDNCNWSHFEVLLERR